MMAIKPAKMKMIKGLLALCWTGLAPSSHAQTRMDILVGPARFQVDVAQTLAERQQGLMFRAELPADQGMLFIQPEPGPAAFWMKNTYISLDLLYFDSQQRLMEIHARVPPCRVPSCPVYTSQGPVKYILEINGGTADRLGLKPGDRLRLP